MKGKVINKKKKVGKIVLIGMSFLLTILLTFSFTLAWFYDSDWASNYINMAGAVGIEIQRQQKYDENGDPIYGLDEITTSGAGNLHFLLGTGKDSKAYPGQAIDAVSYTHLYSDWAGLYLKVPAFTIEIGPVTAPTPIPLEFVEDAYLRNRDVPITLLNTLSGEM